MKHFLLALLILALFPTTLFAQDASKDDVTGSVVDAAGNPVHDAKITYYCFKKANGDVIANQDITPDQDGKFTASVQRPNIQAGEDCVWIAENSTGICLFTVSIASAIAKTPPPLVLRLVPLAKYTLQFYCEGHPASHLKIAPSSFDTSKDDLAFASWSTTISSRWSAETDADGVAVLDGLPAGYKLHLNFDDEQYAALTDDDAITILDNGRTRYDLKLAGWINGTITRDGVGVAGLTVTARSTTAVESESAVTDGDGHYRIIKLAPDEYDVTVHDMGSDWAPPHLQKVKIEADKLSNADFTITHGAVINGKVVDADGNPVPSVSVSTADLYLDGVTTAGDGTFTLRLSPGEHELTVWGYQIRGSKTVDLSEGDTTDVQIETHKATGTD